MEMLKVVLFCSCAISAVYTTGENPKCKFPSQWQSNVFFDLGLMMILPGQANGSGTFYYDYTNKQMRLDLAGIEHANNVSFDYTIIWRFNESAFYTVDHVNKTCEREVGLSDFWEQWEGLPADSLLEHFGDLGSFNKAVGQYYLVRDIGEPTGNVSVSIDVILGDLCPPLRLALRDLGIAPFGTFTYYYEFLDITDITNPKVFTPPPHCQNITLPYNLHRKKGFRRHLGLFMGYSINQETHIYYRIAQINLIWRQWQGIPGTICPSIRLSFLDTLQYPVIGVMYHYQFLKPKEIKDSIVFKPLSSVST